jgi:hypothetical protein
LHLRQKTFDHWRRKHRRDAPLPIANYSEIQYIDVALYNEQIDTLLAENQFNDVLFMSYVTNAVKGDYPAHLETMAGVQIDE